jgi:hypothetical protein
VKKQQFWQKFSSSRNYQLAAVAITFGVIGSVVLFTSHAATPAVSVETESGTVGSPAASLSDTTASGGSAVKFKAAASGGACPVAGTNIPGAADPFGGCFPGPGNTGVPAGTSLTAYTGPCTITTPNTVINQKIVDNCGQDGITIATTGVQITKSRINGAISATEDSNTSFSLIDSEVNAGVVWWAAVATTHMTILRANITGGETSIYCYMDCNIKDTYIHAQGLDQTQEWHLGGILANDGPTDLTVTHSTLACDTPSNPVDGGCSGDFNLFGDFGPISNVLAQNNLLVAKTTLAYCSYGGTMAKPYPHANNVRYLNNIFQRGTNGKCGAYGAIDSFDINEPGNAWTNNKWDDGSVINSFGN